MKTIFEKYAYQKSRVLVGIENGTYISSQKGKEMIHTIYEKIVLEEKQRIRMETEKEILELFQKDCANPKEDEEYRDKIYQAIFIAEKGGFVMGFRYAVNLLMECAEEKKHKSCLEYEG